MHQLGKGDLKAKSGFPDAAGSHPLSDPERHPGRDITRLTSSTLLRTKEKYSKFVLLWLSITLTVWPTECVIYLCNRPEVRGIKTR